MKKPKTVLSARKEKIRIYDPLEALIARMCDPEDPIYDKGVAEAQLQDDEASK